MIPPKVIELYKEVYELLLRNDVFPCTYREIKSGILFKVEMYDSYGHIRIYYNDDNYIKLDLSLLRKNPNAEKIKRNIDETVMDKLSILSWAKGFKISC
jgi:hypothetical protein